uniref:Uncharacterized protein n=1 Tax=Amphimedon queenslandica TaxID=400682 RepID=A0A1X7TWB0_AMPQE
MKRINLPFTSSHAAKDLKHPDRKTPLKVLAEKTSQFLKKIWDRYVAKNKVIVDPVANQDDIEEEEEDTPIHVMQEGEIIPSSDDESDV